MKITLSLFILLLPWSFAAQQENRRDGNWWIGQPPSAKFTYMVGFFDGMPLGWHFSYWKFEDDKSGCIQKVFSSYQEHNEKFLNHVVNVQIDDGLDVFYKDYRNRSILVSNAVWIVLNEIAGTPKSEIDKMREGFRHSAQR
ncbi:MAG TPA: hypothetical protein VIG25_03100 [Pyrinomonadaceae bacterium]